MKFVDPVIHRHVVRMLCVRSAMALDHVHACQTISGIHILDVVRSALSIMTVPETRLV